MAGKRTAVDDRLHSVERIHQLLSRLGWIWPLIVLLALLAFAAGGYLLLAQPQAQAGALWRVRAAAGEVHDRAGKLIADIEQVLLTSQEWSRDGMLGVGDPVAFNRLLVPLVGKWPVNAVQLANDEGRAMLLMRTADGWANRVTDVPIQGRQHRWLYWKDARTPLGEEWKKEEWDPRQRPWYTGAMVVPELQVVWMAPYVQQMNGEAVISASIRWYDARGHQWVLSFSIDLVGLSRFVAQQPPGESGQVALLTADGKLLGLSRHPLFVKTETIRQSLLQEPGRLGLRVLDVVLRQAARQPAENGAAGSQRLVVSAEESGDGREWLASVMMLTAGRQSFRVVAMVPAAEMAGLPLRRGFFLAAVVAAIGTLSVLCGYLLTRPVRLTLTRLFARLEEKRGQAENQVERRNTVAVITARMQRAQSPGELASSLLSELAPRLQLGQALFCLWDESAGRLNVAAAYAGEGGSGEGGGEALADSVPAAHRGLLEQCAVDRRTIVLREPGVDYVRVRSGLGDAAPAVIVLLPVQYGGRLFAVMELASMREFSEDDRLLLADLEAIIALNLDILLRAERTEELLAQTAANEERHRLILGAVADGIWGTDADGCTGFVNRTALEMLGFSEADVVGKDMHALVHARYPNGREYPVSACPISLTARDGQPRTVDDEVFWHKDGHAVHVEYTTTAVHRQDEIVGVVVVFRDIGGRKAAERSERESAALLWQILEDSPAAAAIVTEDGRMLRYNKRLLEGLGANPDYFETHRMAEFWERPEERAAFVEQLKKSGVIHDYRTRFRRADGSLIPVVLSSRWVVQGSQRLLLSWMTEDLEAPDGAAAERRGDAS